MKGQSSSRAWSGAQRGDACRGVALLWLALFALVFIQPSAAQSAAVQVSPDGYWELTAEFPEYDLSATVRLESSADGTVRGVVMGPTSGRGGSFAGRLNGDRLALTVPGPGGEMGVDLALSGDTLAGTWTSDDLKGSVKGRRVAPRKPEPGYYPKYLKAVLQIVKENFYDPAFNGADVAKLEEKYAAQLAGVRDDADFAQLVRRMLGEFGTSHTDFYLAPDELPLKEKQPPIAWRRLSPQTAYLRIRHFDPLSPQQRQDYERALGQAMKESAGAQSLVIDLRGNRGGALPVMFRALGYFLRGGQPVGYAFARAGAGKAGAVSDASGEGAKGLPVVGSTSPTLFRDIVQRGAVAITLDAAPADLYRGRVALLLDGRCYSSCELFSAILHERGGATLIGTRTGGEALGSFTDVLVKNMILTKKDTGWRLEVPIIDFRTGSGRRVEGVGVAPDIEVTKRGAGDAALAEALRQLERISTSRK